MNEQPIIVGAGPTGLLLGIALLKYNINPIILDKRTADSTCEAQALTLHGRTLEIFKDLGLYDKFAHKGIRIHNLKVLGARGNNLVTVDLTEVDKEFDYVLSLPQYETERILRETFTERGGIIQWEREVVEMDDRAVGVKLTVRGPETDEEEEMLTNWICACDGSNSTIRKLQGLKSTAKLMNIGYIAASCAIEGFERELTCVLSEDGPVIIQLEQLDEETRVRILIEYPHDRLEEVPDDIQLNFVQELLDERCPFLRVTLSNPDWITKFSVTQSFLPFIQKGRVFYLGDAGSTLSPVGGQGLNAGIQDAYNLGWKLGIVANGYGKTLLIDSYNIERQPIGEALIEDTTRSTSLALTHSKFLQVFRDATLSIFGSFDFIQHSIIHELGMIEVSYTNSPLTRRGSPVRHGLRKEKLAKPGGRVVDHLVYHPDDPYESLHITDILLDYQRHFVLILLGTELSETQREQIHGFLLTLERYDPLVKAKIVLFDINIDVSPLIKTVGDENIFYSKNNDMSEYYGSEKSYILIRPDNHIAVATPGPEEIHKYLEDVFY